MELVDITREQWEDAVDASILHCSDGKHRTEDSYLGYNNNTENCALCGLFRKNFHKYCPISEPISSLKCSAFYDSCCPEWRDGNHALTEIDFSAFHDAYVRLVRRLKDVRERGYEAWRAAHLPKGRVWKAGDLALWDGTNGNETNRQYCDKGKEKSDNGIVRLSRAGGFDWDLVHPVTREHIFFADEPSLSPLTEPYSPWHEGDYAQWDGTTGKEFEYLDRVNQTDNGIVELVNNTTCPSNRYTWDLVHPQTGKHIVYANSPALSPAPVDYKPTERRKKGHYGRRGTSGRRRERSLDKPGYVGRRKINVN